MPCFIFYRRFLLSNIPIVIDIMFSTVTVFAGAEHLCIGWVQTMHLRVSQGLWGTREHGRFQSGEPRFHKMHCFTMFITALRVVKTKYLKE